MAVRADDVDLSRDRSLVERFQGGDLSGFEDLYRRYFQRLYRFCLRRVGNPHEAEDVAQEAFARAFRAMPSLAGERRFYPWVSVIAARLCVDNHRRTSRSEPACDIDLGAVDGGQDAVFDEVDRLLLAQALAQLGPRHREVLRLREEEGWSYQRIADHFEVSMGTVEALLFRARKALRREFEKVAGLESGLAALPVLGAVARRFNRAKMRLAAVNAQGFAPLIGNGFAAAVVVTGIAALGASGGPAASTTSPQVAAHVAALPPASVAGAPVSAAPPAAESGVATSGSAPARPTPTGGVVVTRGSGDARGYAEQAPVGGQAGPLSGGADPASIVQDTTAAAIDIVTGRTTVK